MASAVTSISDIKTAWSNYTPTLGWWGEEINKIRCASGVRIALDKETPVERLEAFNTLAKGENKENFATALRASWFAWFGKEARFHTLAKETYQRLVAEAQSSNSGIMGDEQVYGILGLPIPSKSIAADLLGATTRPESAPAAAAAGNGATGAFTDESTRVVNADGHGGSVGGGAVTNTTVIGGDGGEAAGVSAAAQATVTGGAHRGAPVDGAEAAAAGAGDEGEAVDGDTRVPAFAAVPGAGPSLLRTLLAPGVYGGVGVGVGADGGGGGGGTLPVAARGDGSETAAGAGERDEAPHDEHAAAARREGSGPVTGLFGSSIMFGGVGGGSDLVATSADGGVPDGTAAAFHEVAATGGDGKRAAEGAPVHVAL